MPSSAWIPHRFYLLNFCDDFSSLPFAPISASIQFACANGRGKVIKFSENNFPFFPVSHSRRKSQRRRVAIHIKCEENKTEIITNHNEVYSTPQTVVILCKNVCHSKGKLLSILFIFFIWLLFICPLAGWCVLVPKKNYGRRNTKLKWTLPDLLHADTTHSCSCSCSCWHWRAAKTHIHIHTLDSLNFVLWTSLAKIVLLWIFQPKCIETTSTANYAMPTYDTAGDRHSWNPDWTELNTYTSHENKRKTTAEQFFDFFSVLCF